MSNFLEPITVAIDVGTTKICVLVARQRGDGGLEIIGVGRSPSHGLKKGVVVDINQTVESIKTAVHEAELLSGYAIESAVIGISGGHIRSLNSHGAVPIKRNEVKETDIEHVLEAAKAVAIPEGQQILHVLPQYFSIDNQERVLNPLGMAGVRLEAQVHIITGSMSSAHNLVTCCQMAGVKVNDMVLEQLASAQAVLSNDERELGVGVLDIGGGTSDFAIYQQGSIRHTMVLPIAGNHFTNDLAIGLQTTLAEAERVKVRNGLVSTRTASIDQLITVKKINSDEMISVPQAEIAHILQFRARELLTLIRREVDQYHLRSVMTTGLVLTGGGSLLSGMQPLAAEILGMPIRLGIPKTGHILPESLDNPIYATGYGLLLRTIADKKGMRFDFEGNASMARVLLRMKLWISDFF